MTNSNLDSILCLIESLPTMNHDHLKMILDKIASTFPTLIELPDEETIDALHDAFDDNAVCLADIIAAALQNE